MESSEGLETSENLAEWIAGPKAPRASWHYGVDADSIVQSVREDHIAWHAPGANHNSIGIEHAGRASQTAEQWADEYSLKMLDLSSGLAAEICKRWHIPPVIVDVLRLRLGDRGITTHANVSLAFNRSTHWDPGPEFPLEAYVETVAARLALLEASA